MASCLAVPMIIDVAAELTELEERASFFRSERRKDVELYTLLADCMWLAIKVQAEGREAEIISALKDKMRRQTNRNRVYVEKSSDAYTIIGRLVFQAPKGASTSSCGSATTRPPGCR